MNKLFTHQVFAVLKTILPPSVSRLMRAIATAFLTPIYFSSRSGHFISSLQSRSMDKKGLPIPWYTYPAVEFLYTKNFSQRSVLEFGAGQSTLWWAKNAKDVTSFEEDKNWYEIVKTKMPKNVRLIYCSDLMLEMFHDQIAQELFDIIIIDGFDRLEATKKARHNLKGDGIIIVDNAEGYWGENGTYPIIDLLTSEGMLRVDFYGHSPANITVSCTSIFFRTENWCFLQDSPPTIQK